MVLILSRLSGEDQTSERGSVLIDALVAIGVMTITLTLAAQAIGESARRTRDGELSRVAALEARSRMAEVGGDIALAPGRSSGEDADLVWRVEVAPASSALATRTARLLAVSVVVADRGGRPLVTLRSLRLGASS